MRPGKTGRSERARIEGSPGIEPRLRGVARMVWPLPVAAGMAGYLLRAAWTRPVLSPPTAGAILVALAAATLVYLHTTRRRLSRFLKGARGEESVARELDLLSARYQVFHGVRLPPAEAGGAWADCDHIVAGPCGIAVIETKNWAGPIEVRDGRLLVEGREPTRPPLAQVKRAAASLRHVLERGNLHTVPVFPVLAFASDALPSSVLGLEGVVLCRREAVRRVLEESMEPALPEGVQARAVTCIRPWVNSA